MEWKSLFAPHILDRGYDYFCGDAVEDMAAVLYEWSGDEQDESVEEISSLIIMRLKALYQSWKIL